MGRRGWKVEAELHKHVSSRHGSQVVDRADRHEHLVYRDVRELYFDLARDLLDPEYWRWLQRVLSLLA